MDPEFANFEREIRILSPTGEGEDTRYPKILITVARVRPR